MTGVDRSDAALRHHYEVEKKLADDLWQADAEQRRTLYGKAYDELFREVPDHPQLTRKKDDVDGRIRSALNTLGAFLKPNSVFMEVGAGDCQVTCAVAKQVAHSIAIDVSDAVATSIEWPRNAELRLSNGTDIPVADGTVDVAYSNQLMEHLHPEDAKAQLCNIAKTLRPGGVYVCVTPHRYLGPHDVSRYFDDVARGLHLKEYTYKELKMLMQQAGFSKADFLFGVKGHFRAVPLVVAEMIELGVSPLPHKFRRRLLSHFPARALFGIVLVAHK